MLRAQEMRLALLPSTHEPPLSAEPSTDTNRISVQPALSVKYTDIARDNEDDKTPKLSVQRIFAGLYSSTEKVRSANEYCTTNDVRWAHVSSIMRCGGGPVD